MKENQRTKWSMGVTLVGGTALVLALAVAVLPNQAWATHICPTSSTADSDADGLTDAQECSGITTVKPKGGTAVSFPKWNGDAATRQNSVDPDTKDVFICLTKTSPSLLDEVAGGVDFLTSTLVSSLLSSYSPLGVTAHLLKPGQSRSDRTFVATPSPTAAQKCIRVAESLDTNGEILGQMNWGTPLGLDAGVCFTQRIKDHVNNVCNAAGQDGSTAAGAAHRLEQRKNLTLWCIRHESKHSGGGLAAEYLAANGGYHYPCGAGTTMEQCVTYRTTGGTCSWDVPTGWNTILDPPAVRLK